jgi:NAD(P)-dependent dehydrogenase (short-subunit alcohol dehydrogenase family)
VVVVTGGASGIGLATAVVLHQRGWRVIISDINAEANRDAASSIGVEAVSLDVVDESASARSLTLRRVSARLRHFLRTPESSNRVAGRRTCRSSSSTA